MKLKPKAVFGSKFSEDQELYRASILAKQDDGKFLVQYIDFGNTEEKQHVFPNCGESMFMANVPMKIFWADGGAMQ